ncbi:MAG: DUF3040 domain-containing protein [Brachybacterium sp.]|uniref:DUF3040 domain-containing protein n=1 Tax=Brachybacterium sp. TaxID=1891286 RepID=UPI0026520A2E|nr:DUF3040 domain-containing protein [Brachybacterium sp.]MDN6327712.1 DUF3040 domain-containing protein [Brachybacterium sp.]MDN6400233.1 DUF3040 domain-containing protein [Brachybacterium sp.]
MPLSEHEQKMLDEMERQLFADDPRLARAFAPKTPPRRSGRRILIGLGAVVVGLVVLVLAVSLPAIWLGVIAFIGMLAGAVYAVTGSGSSSEGKGTTDGGGGGGGAGPAAPGGDDGGAFMRKMEERWEKRAGDDPRF